MKTDAPVCKNVLCIRPDNMGDLIMTSPALFALKQHFNCRITLLTSSMAAPVTNFIDAIDEVIIYDFFWVKTDSTASIDSYNGLVKNLKNKNFDTAIIFTVYSQNPLPAAMLAWQACIPARAAWCRENPYGLLTHWLPDKEPYTFIKHQVERDCDLVESLGASIDNNSLRLKVNEQKWPQLVAKLQNVGIDLIHLWIIVHTPVSEEKRKFAQKKWAIICKQIISETGCKILLTGNSTDANEVLQIASAIGPGAISIAGLITIEELILLVHKSPLIITVNTVAMHIAAAVATPVIALYALSNPQHYPWKATGKVFTYSIDEELQSKNEVIRFATKKYLPQHVVVNTNSVVEEAVNILTNGHAADIPTMPFMSPMAASI